MTRSIHAPISGTRRRPVMSYEERCTREWLERKGLRPEEVIVMEVEPAPVEKAEPQPASNGSAPPAGSPPPLCVGDVVTLNSGGERMTIVHAYPDTVYVMAYSEGKMTKLRLPRECVTKGE